MSLGALIMKDELEDPTYIIERERRNPRVHEVIPNLVAGRNVRTKVLPEILLIDCKVEKNDRKAVSVSEEFE